jgi:hypothetical protein
MSKRKTGCLFGALVPLVAVVVIIYGFHPWFRPSITAKKLAIPNPTSYVFNSPVNEIRAALKKKVVKCCGSAIEFKDDVLFSGELLKMPGNKNDAYIHNFHDPIGISDVYFADGKGLRYLCEFHLHIISISNGETRVEVIPLHAEVINGQTWWGNHLARANIYVNVAPTSIEEYKILLELGAGLGETNMPVLVKQ